MLAGRLRQLRREKNLLQKDIADYLGITTSAYGFYEQSKREPDKYTLERLADFFGTTVDYLLGRTDSREIPDKKIEAAIESDPELKAFWQVLQKRDDLKTFFKQVMNLSPDSIRRAIRVIKAIEDEEKGET